MILLFACCIACGASAETQFTAYMVTKDQPLFIIHVDDSTSGWMPLASEFHGCRISAFDPKTETLTVEYAKAQLVLPLKAAKVGSAPLVTNEPLRTLKGLPLAYEVARRGDEDTRAILIRYQQALGEPNNTKAHQNALAFLRTMLDRVAAKGAQRILAQPSNPSSGRASPSGTSTAVHTSVD